MPDLGIQLRWYYDSVVVLANPADVIAGRVRPPVGPEPEAAGRWWRRPVVVVVAAAALTLVLIGGIALLSILPSEEPAVTTTMAPTTTAAPPPSTTTTLPGTTTAISSTTTTSVASTIPAMPASLATTWQRVQEQSALENGWIAAVTEGGPGLVAVGGTGRPIDAGVWVSSDGAAWERISSDAFRGTEQRDGTDGDQQILDVVATSSGLVAVGVDEMVQQEVGHATVWLSPDGRTWSRLHLPHDDSVSPSNSALFGVVVGGPGLVAWGEDGNGPGIWASTDGRAWTLSTDPDLAPTGEEITLAEQEGLCTGLNLMDVTAGNGLLVAVGYRTVGTCEGMPGDTLGLSPLVWVSEDGLAWDRIPQDAITLPAPMPYSDWGFVMRGVTWTNTGFVAVGLGVWVSEDGRQWEALDATLYESTFSSGWAIGESAFVGDLDGRLMAALPPGDVLWASDDGGVGWYPSAEFDGGYLEVLEPSTPEAHATLTEVISTGQALVAVGSAVQYLGTDDPGNAWPCNRAEGWCRSDAAIWIGQWNDD
jgi:hypothetical protein